MRETILSLCDYSGTWSSPYSEAGYTVIKIDLKNGQDIRTLPYPGRVHGILAAPPCTHLAASGARWWKEKGPEALLESLALVDACLRFVAICRPVWWVLENPVGRLRTFLGKPRLIFNPCDYGDAYTKKTCLWGDFNVNLPRTPVEPIQACKQGSWLQQLPGQSDRTAEIRSITPRGFAQAFHQANP